MHFTMTSSFTSPASFATSETMQALQEAVFARMLSAKGARPHSGMGAGLFHRRGSVQLGDAVVRAARRPAESGHYSVLWHGHQRPGDRARALRNLRRVQHGGGLPGAPGAILSARHEAGFQIAKPLRDVCIFARHDLARGSSVLQSGFDQLQERADLYGAESCRSG